MLELVECETLEERIRSVRIPIEEAMKSAHPICAALEADHEFLLRGDVFTKDVIETWLSYKREKEVDAIALRPHPYEFHLYYDI